MLLRAAQEGLSTDRSCILTLAAVCLPLARSVLNQSDAKHNSADLNIAYRMKTAEYQQLCEYSEALEENWGKPPGQLNSNGQVRGRAFLVVCESILSSSEHVQSKNGAAAEVAVVYPAVIRGCKMPSCMQHT